MGHEYEWKSVLLYTNYIHPDWCAGGCCWFTLVHKYFGKHSTLVNWMCSKLSFSFWQGGPALQLPDLLLCFQEKPKDAPHLKLLKFSVQEGRPGYLSAALYCTDFAGCLSLSLSLSLSLHKDTTKCFDDEAF